MPHNQQRENFFKLFTLVYLHGTNINRELLQYFLTLKSLTFKQFINDHQHEIFHFFSNSRCCQCEKNTVLQNRILLKKPQMLIIFDKNSNRLEKHEQHKKGELCCLKAKTSVELTDLDLTFIRFFLVNICHEVFWKCHLRYVKKTFSDFLDESVHKVYHLSVSKICCCKCSNDIDIPTKQQISESQFRIIFDTDGKTCQSYCSCQYKIKNDISLPLLIVRDKKLFTELTRYFCSCQKHLENIIEIRNEIAHESFACGITDETFAKFWEATTNNILGIAKTLGVHGEYQPKLQELKKECSPSYCQTCMIQLIKKSDHFAPEIVRRIDNSTEETKFEAVMACLEDFHISTCNTNVKSGCVATIEDSLLEFAKYVRKRYTEESSSELPEDIEVCVSVEIRQSTQLLNRANEDDQDKPDKFTCGKCDTVFYKLEDFLVHKKNIYKKENKSAEHITTKKMYQIKIGGAGKEWPTDAINEFKNSPNCFDTENTTVCLMETGCLIVWAESSSSDLDSKDKVKKHCIEFTQNMFKKCSLESMETANVNVTVKYSELLEESDNDVDDYLECGRCGLGFHTINSFVAHKKECVRNRKRRRENEIDESKGENTLTETSKKRRIDGILKEEENFLRIAVLLTRVATAAVRIVFNREFKGDSLHRTLTEEPNVLHSLHRKRIINSFQWQLIFPQSGPASLYSLNLKLMVKLIQFFQTTRYVEDVASDPKDVSLEADLSRVLYYSNLIAGSEDTKLTEDKMEEYWIVISQAIERLGGKEFRHKCNNLKVSELNENYIEMLTEIKEISKPSDSKLQGFQRLLDNLFYIKQNTATPRTVTVISQEEANFLKIAHLLLRIGAPAVRTIFDEEFDPKVLQKELMKKSRYLHTFKRNGKINPAQWNKLFPRGEKAQSINFDLLLMIFLIGEYTAIVISKKLPSPTDNSKGADLYRLKYYWKLIALNQDCVLLDQDFKEYWTAIKLAIVRIGGTAFEKRCIDLDKYILDQNSIEVLPEIQYSNIPIMQASEIKT